MPSIKKAPRKRIPKATYFHLTLSQWLDKQPEEDEIRFKEGVPYLPIEVCEKLLDYMANYGLIWNTRNYQSKYFSVGGELYISASLELYFEPGDAIEEDDKNVFVKRYYNKSLVGVTTFPVRGYLPNIHFDSIAKSLCTVNAASDLGNRFGRLLYTKEDVPIIQVNEDPVNIGTVLRNGKKGVKTIPDETIWNLYRKAVGELDKKTMEKLEKVYQFNEE